MSEDALTDIANALLRLRHAFQKHRLDPPVRLELKDEEQMIKLGMALRSSTQFDYRIDLDAPRKGGELAVSVCGIDIAATAGDNMRRVSTIAFRERLLPVSDSDKSE